MSSAAVIFRLGPLAAVPPGEGRVFFVADREVAVFRTRTGELHATAARCPHRGGPLADGLLGDGCVVCPLHGFTFDVRTGRTAADCDTLRTFRVSVDQGGDLYLELP